jgi:hypothetical protein
VTGCNFNLSVRQHHAQTALIGFVNRHRLVEITFLLGGFGCQYVAREGMSANEFPAGGCLEPFGGATMSLDLRHLKSPVNFRNQNSGAGARIGVRSLILTP